MVLYDYAIVQGTFNISSDVFMMLIPLPLILTVSVALKQKVVLFVIFSMGAFVIVAAVLTKAFFFANVYSDSYMFWYTREASVAVYVANLPCIWPLLREALPVLRSWTPGFVSSGIYRRRTGHATSTGPMTRGAGTRTNPTRRSFDEFQKIVDQRSATTTTKSTGGSQVREVRDYNRPRIEGGDASSDSASDEMPMHHGIMAHTTIEMNILTPEQGSRRTSRDLDPNISRNSSNGDYSNWDLEKGGPRPASNV